MTENQSNVVAKPAVLEMTISIKRAATGETETYQLVGTPEVAADDDAETSETE